MTPFSKEYRPLWLRKLHSLTGVVPIGIFLIVHLWTNAKAMQGRTVFDDSVAVLQGLPLLGVIEVLGIFAPLLFHGLYGIKLSFDRHPHSDGHPYAKPLPYALQRVSGIAVLAFIAYHFCQFRLKVLLGDMAPSDFLPELCAALSTTTSYGVPFVALAYLSGIGAVAFHFAYGLHAFCHTWRLGVSERTLRMASVAFTLLGVTLFLIGADTVLFLATGVGLIPR